MISWLIEYQFWNDPASYYEVVTATDENAACKILRQKYPGYDIDISAVSRY